MAAIDTFVQRVVINLIKKNRIASVCDYGCGKGDLLTALANEFPGSLRLTGVDYFSKFPEASPPISDNSIALIDRGTNHYDELLDSRRFDMIVSTFALHHYRYPVAELRNMATLLSPGGTMILADLAFDNVNDAQIVKNISSYVTESFASFRGQYHRHHYTLEEALDIVSAIDVEVTESSKKTIPPDGADLEEEVESHLAHFDRMIEVLPEMKSSLVEDYFRLLIPYTKALVQEHKIDYSSVFVIVARKS